MSEPIQCPLSGHTLQFLIREIAEEIVRQLRESGQVKPKEDYCVADIRQMTGYSAKQMAGLKLYGQYFIGGKRVFRREVIDYRRKVGLNLAEGKW